ncbi:MAG TPA: hypothetical protein VF335_02000 [Chitinivibrionales bacterium]
MNKLVAAVVMASVFLFGAVGIQAQQTDPAGGAPSQESAQKPAPKKAHKGKHHKKQTKTKETKTTEETTTTTK